MALFRYFQERSSLEDQIKIIKKQLRQITTPLMWTRPHPHEAGYPPRRPVVAGNRADMSLWMELQLEAGPAGAKDSLKNCRIAAQER